MRKSSQDPMVRKPTKPQPANGKPTRAGGYLPNGKSAARRPLLSSTRQRIIDYLQVNRSATTVELAQAWGLTVADLRYHMALLCRQGILEKVNNSPAGEAGPGRPASHYRLARTAASGNLAGLCQALLKSLFDPLPVERKESVIHILAKTIVTRSNPTPRTTTSARLNQLIEELNHANYQARWEAHAHGPHIIFRNCPYAAVIKENPELCQVDRALIESVTLGESRQTMKIDLDTGQPPICVFEISPDQGQNRNLP